ncbi:hypothetical protein NQ315_016265, partial [Exocentrus adspersus]
MAKTKKIDKKHRFNRTLFNYTAEQLKNALAAVKNGMPVLTASKTFKVPRSTLRYKVSGDRLESFGKVGPNCILGDDVEKLLCDWMKASCAKGFPVTKDEEENKKKRAENKQKRIEEQNKRKRHNTESKEIKRNEKPDNICKVQENVINEKIDIQEQEEE